MVPYVKKYIIFWLFHIFENFNTKLTIEIKFCMKSIHEKFIIYFSRIGHYIISNVEKFKVKIPLVREEIEKRNLIKG
jgi:hypothetical protein